MACGPIPLMIQSLLNRRCVSVITYHSVIDRPLPFFDWSFLDSELFRKQIAYLSRKFKLLSLSSAVELLEKDALEGPAAVITFDDGFQNNFDVAFPILREYQAPATIFLATDYIGSEQTVWFTRLISGLAITACKDLYWNGGHYPLVDSEQKGRSSARLQAALKLFPADCLEAELIHIESLLSVPLRPPVLPNSPFRMLDPASIDAMLGSGLVEFGAHTGGHAILSRLSTSEKTSQIQKSIRQVEKLTGKKCTSFAYPNGGRLDYDDESQRILAEAGIHVAVTMLSGPNWPTTPLLEFHRYPIGADTSFSRFKLMAHNVV